LQSVELNKIEEITKII